MRKDEVDLNGIIILGLSKVGLARNIIFADGYLGESARSFPGPPSPNSPPTTDAATDRGQRLAEAGRKTDFGDGFFARGRKTR